MSYPPLNTPSSKDYSVRCIGGLTLIDAKQHFVIRISEKKVLHSDKESTLMVVQGEIVCTLPSVFSGEDQRNSWDFYIKMERTNSLLQVLEFPNRDKNGTYSTFMRDLIWEMVRRAV